MAPFTFHFAVSRGAAGAASVGLLAYTVSKYNRQFWLLSRIVLF